MTNVKLSDLPVLTLPKYYSNCSSSDTDVTFPALSNGENTRFSLSGIIDAIRDEFAPGKAVITCKWCGQWGARFCECTKCGAPIE